MAAQLDEKITTYFMGNSTNLVQETEKAKKAIGILQRQYSQRVGTVKGSILDPGSLVGKGLDKVAASMKLSATSIGLAAAGGTLLVKTLSAASEFANEQARSMNALSESMRLASRTNLFASSLDGTTTLLSRLKETRGLLDQGKRAQQENDPYGYGGGLAGNTMTVLAKAAQMKSDVVADVPEALRNAMGGVMKFMSPGIGDYADLNLRRAAAGGYSSSDRQKDAAAQLQGEQENLQKQAARLQRAIARDQRDQLAMTRERLTGSVFDARVTGLHRERRAELQGIKGTDANTEENRRNIYERYKEQIGAERELQDFSELRHKRMMEEEGIARRLVTDEEKRVLTIQKELEDTREQLAGTHLTTETRQALTEQREQQQTALNVAKADLAVARAQHQLAVDTAAIGASNASATAQAYQTELATAAALRSQLAAVKDVNASKAQGLQITLAESENRIRLMRQESLYGKSASQITRGMDQDRKERVKRDQFDRRMGLTAGGLLRPDRDMAGNIIGGIDPITGQYRTAGPGTGLAERGLSTGSLSDRATRIGGGASLIRDRDPNGGLSGGETPRFFEQSTAAGYLAGKEGVGALLARHAGDPAHDPAARLAQASIFRDLRNPGASGAAGAFIGASRPKFDHGAAHIGMAALSVQRDQLGVMRSVDKGLKNLYDKMDDLVFH